MTSVRSRNRAGFSRTDLAVTLLIAAATASLLAPALANSSQQARLLECQRHLQTIGLAFQAHHRAHGTFPPCRTRTPIEYGWGVNLLPYLGEEKLHRQFHFDHHFYAEENQPVIATPLAVFQCPAAPAANRNVDIVLGLTDYGTHGVAGDYFANHNVNPMYQVNGKQGKPALMQNEFQVLSAITDGLSNTTLILEHAGRPEHYVGRTKQPDNNALAAGPGWWGCWASYQSFHFQGYAQDKQRRGWDCAVNCNNSQGLYSFHRGGANALFCDGSVRFLAESLQVELAFALVTRDSQEIIDLAELTAASLPDPQASPSNQ